MSDVNPEDLRIINDKDDVRHLYQGAGRNAKIGIEVELAFFDPKTPDLKPMSIAQNKVVKNATNAACGGDFVRNEPTSEMLEIGSFARGPENLRDVLDDTNAKIACLSKKAADVGLKRSYFQHLPDRSAAQLLQNVMDVPRYQAFFGPPRNDMRAIAAYFSVCKSNQVSVSYRDPDHLLENLRRLYALAPFLFLILDNCAPFNEGQKFSGHAGMHHRASLGPRGGVPPSLYTAKTGADYIDAHIEAVMNNPLFVYYNRAGEIVRLDDGQWTSFNQLREEGLNTATNYYFAQSVLWPDVKIAALKDAEENVTGHRLEARMFGVGLHQHQSAALITGALAFDPDFAEAVDALLSRYGFDLANPEKLLQPLTASYKAAREHDGQFLNIAYGTGRMDDFAKAFATLLERCAFLQDFEAALTPLLTICRTGCTDAKVNAHLFPTLKEAKNFQRDYDPAIFADPNNCAKLLFEAELEDNSAISRSCSRNF